MPGEQVGYTMSDQYFEAMQEQWPHIHVLYMAGSFTFQVSRGSTAVPIVVFDRFYRTSGLPWHSRASSLAMASSTRFIQGPI
jgi:hypothetical protein